MTLIEKWQELKRELEGESMSDQYREMLEQKIKQLEKRIDRENGLG